MRTRPRTTRGDRGDSVTTRVQEWVLLYGHRGVIAGGIALGLFALLTLVLAVQPRPFHDTAPVYYVLFGMISGNVTIITVVVSINQLLISREMMTPEELQSQIEGTIDYRDRVEEFAGRVAPVEPLGFLQLLFENTRQASQKLGGLAASDATEEAASEVDDVVSNVTESADEVDAVLQQSDPSTFTVLSATLGTNYARDIRRLREIESEHGDSISDDVAEAIDDLVYHLHDIDVARQYFKGVYLQQELAALSRLLFYIGLPAIVAVVSTLLLFAGGGLTAVSPPYHAALVSATITAGLVPLVTLFVFILRTATVARRTAAKIPFTTPSQET